MKKTDIRICGMGGQGVIMSGMVLGKAASIYEDRWSTLIQSFGPEARGSTCAAQVMLSDDKIGYPYLKGSDLFLCLSQAGYDKYVDELKEGGTLIYESELITLDDRMPKDAKAFGIPATRLTQEKIGKLIVFNMVMLGFLVANAKIVSEEAARKAVENSVPDGTQQLNMTAFNLGFEYKE
jgi:2-oxoglutarate ferredoxin oxidoreductase subunit gamma